MSKFEKNFIRTLVKASIRLGDSAIENEVMGRGVLEWKIYHFSVPPYLKNGFAGILKGREYRTLFFLIVKKTPIIVASIC